MKLAPLVVVVGEGGVGKTTVAAALAMLSAKKTGDTLVMTFDPSHRLKDALGVGREASSHEVRVNLDSPGRLDASLLDARETFDRLIARYAPDEQARDRILGNRYYDHLSGSLGGLLEYMAVERLFEVTESRDYDRVVLDTPPTNEALEFLEAPERIVGFLDSGALKIAMKPWFDGQGRLRPTAKLGRLGRGLESFLDEMVGLDLLSDMAEFFQSFGPLFDGFRNRALEVQDLLRSRQTLFVLVTGPGQERIPDTMYFARRLREAGMQLGPVAVNRCYGEANTGNGLEFEDDELTEGCRLLGWLGKRDQEGLTALRDLMPFEHPVVAIPQLAFEPSDLNSVGLLAERLAPLLDAAGIEL